MSLTLPKNSGKEFETAPSGTFPATCYRLIDLGTQQIEWQGKIKRQPKIMLSWELSDEMMSDGKPFSIHKRYTLSSSDKSSLRKDLEAWRGVAFTDSDFGTFDIGVLLGKSCLLGIVHEAKDGNTYANISSLLRLPKNMPAPVLVNPITRFDLSNFSQHVFDGLSESLQAVIAKSPEYQALKGGHRVESHTADDAMPEEPPVSAYDEIPF